MMVRLILFAALSSLAASCGQQGDSPAPSSGQRAFAECATCHTVAPPDTPAGRMKLVGPNLYGIYGAPAARLSDYAYSDALRRSGVVWDEAMLDAYIANPQKAVRGTRMSFAGVPDPENRRAIIDYLKTLK